ncbi:Peptide chain release factor 1 (eRF1) [Algoriphagus alkaliphilus]|uniref:Peptide chain release factor 1 (ERF1) n=1 Tax=Algoriphagus alkaliphilus TaxID=279824 RepID=A0A1G5YQE4_9BACT|nr:hypothetical protein [Algoriphagus alkaliphilus]MBA4299503.1 hypothetical protein [Cyclobacterium sp.]SDA84841.1 Peptide chain release factor 1 (eRF1) [Algoriphagus alkaliphilus]
MKTNKNTTPVNKALLQELLAVAESPCLSLYMPTHRTHPENLQNPVRFKNLMKELETSLLRKYSKDEIEKHLQPLLEITGGDGFWNYTSEGLAIFSSPGYSKAVDLATSPKEMAIVADTFHTKPIQYYLQSTGRFHVLAINRHDIQLFEGNRHSLVELELHALVPATMTDALGEEKTDKHSTVASYGGTGASMHHGHGGKKEEVDIDSERYFRAVAESVAEHYSKPTGIPLLLAALPEYHHLFHQVNKNPLLLEDGIKINPTAVSIDKMAAMAWEIMEPEFLKKQEELVSRYNQSKANGLGSEDIKEVAVALVEGRVDTLLIEADRIIASRITNLVTGNVQNKDINNPRVDDLLDDMSELALRMGGQVTVLNPDQMPSESGVAAILRY